MAITYDNPEVNSMGISPVDRSRMSGEIVPRETLGNKVLQEQKQLQLQSGKPVINPMASLGESAVYAPETSNPDRAWYQSKYDDKINWNYDPLGPNDLSSKRAEAQGAWGRLKDSTINNVTILGTTFASDVISLTGGLLSSIIQGDMSKMWDNNAVNALGDFQRRKLEERQIFRTQDYENQSAFRRLGSGIFWAELWQNAGYMEGMLIPGMAMGRLAQSSKLLANAPKIVTKIGANSIAAIGEASMEALNQKKDSEKDLYAKADRLFREKLANAQNWDEKERLYDEYGKDLKQIQNDVVAIGNRTFAGNVALLTATGTFEFGDFVSRGYVESHKLLQQIMRNEAGQAVGKSAFNAVARGLGQTGKNFFAEGFEEYAQRSLASGAARTRKANGFLEKYQDEFNIDLADNYMSAFFQDMYKDLGNTDAWTEFLSGALMGSIGIPGSHNGAYANIHDALKENQKIENLANEINTFELEHGISSKDLTNNGKAQAYFDALIREAGINAVQNQALIDRDKKTFIDTRVEKVLNLAMLYDNIGEIDDFKKRMEWYSKIENEEQKNELIKQTQDVELDENGNVIKENKQSPFKDMSIEEINQKLKEANEFYAGIIDDFIDSKRFIDDKTKGKLDVPTLLRGAAARTQALNFKKRAIELYNDLNKNINNKRESIVKKDDTSEDGKFLNSFFDNITNLSDDEVMKVFGSAKTKASVYAFGEYIKRNSDEIDSDIINDIDKNLADITNLAMDFEDVNAEVLSIINNYEKEKNFTQKILGKIKNVKKNFLVRKHAKRLSLITDKVTLENELKKVPSELLDDVVEYLKQNGSEATRKIFSDISEWELAYKAILKAVDSYNAEKYPVFRNDLNHKYDSDIIDDVLRDTIEIANNSSSLSEVFEKIDAKIEAINKSIESIEGEDAKEEKILYEKDYNDFSNELKGKIKSFLNTEKEEAKKKKEEKESKDEANKENNNSKEDTTEDIEIPSYIIPSIAAYVKKNKNGQFNNILQESLDSMKDKDGYFHNEWEKFGYKKENLEKNIEWLENYLENKKKELKEKSSNKDEGSNTTGTTNTSETDNTDNGTNNEETEDEDYGTIAGSNDTKTDIDDLQGDTDDTTQTGISQKYVLDRLNDYRKKIGNISEVNRKTHRYYIRDNNNEKKQIAYSVTEFFAKKDNRKDADEEYKFTRAIGNNVDAFVKNYFDGNIWLDSDNYLNFTKKRKESFLESCKELEKDIKEKHGEDAIIMSTSFMIPAIVKHWKEKYDVSIAGEMDFVVIDKDGYIYIYDIKAKRQDYENEADKLYYVEQLNGYRQILSVLFPELKDHVKVGGLAWFKQDYPTPSSDIVYSVDKRTEEVSVKDNGSSKYLKDYDKWKTPEYDGIIEIETKDVFDSIRQYNRNFEMTSDDDNVGIPYLKSDGVSKYKHEDIKRGKLTLFDHPVAKFLDDHGAYDFVDNGHLYDYISYCRNKRIEFSDRANYIKTKIDGDDIYLLAIDTTNDGFFKNKSFGNKIIIDDNGTRREYQVIGMMSENRKNKASRDEFSKIKNEIDKVGDVNEGQYKLSNLHFDIRKINGGRLVYEGERTKEIGMDKLLQDIDIDDFEIGVYKANGEIKLDSSVQHKVSKFRYPKDNGTNRSAGSAYIFVKCADGKYYPRQIRTKKFLDTELKLDDVDANDSFINSIKELLYTICFGENDNEKASAKGSLANYIAFTSGDFKSNGKTQKGKYNVSNLINFKKEHVNGELCQFVFVHDINKDSDDNDGAINITKKLEELGDSKESKNKIVDLVFRQIIRSDKGVKLTPMINIGGKKSNYTDLKNRIKSSSIVTSNTKMRSYDCNFELCLTDDKFNIIKDYEDTDLYKGRKVVATNKKRSFVKSQIGEIYKNFKDLFSDFVNSDSEIFNLYATENPDNENVLDFYINDEYIEPNTNEKLLRILNFINDSMNEYGGFDVKSDEYKNYQSYDKEDRIILRPSKNSKKTYKLIVGDEADKIAEEMNIQSKERDDKKNLEKLENKGKTQEEKPTPVEQPKPQNSSGASTAERFKNNKKKGETSEEKKAEEQADDCLSGESKTKTDSSEMADDAGL